MLAESAEALAALQFKCDDAGRLADLEKGLSDQLKLDLSASDGVASSKSKEAADLLAQLNESERTAGEYMQRCDALQARLKEAQSDIEAARLHGTSQEQELSAQVQRLKSELASSKADATELEASHQQALQASKTELKRSSDALSELQAQLARLQSENAKMLAAESDEPDAHDYLEKLQGLDAHAAHKLGEDHDEEAFLL
jgi:seryl-tRNA synthetase